MTDWSSQTGQGVSDNSEFIGEFLVESTENLDQLDRDLLALEAEPGDPNRLASIFRTVHTIKGNSGFFGFSKLGALAHSGEHLLGRLRDGKLSLDDHITGTLYSMVDAVRSILESIETTGTEGDQDYRELSQRLAAASEEIAAGDRMPVERPEVEEQAGIPAAPQTERAAASVPAPPASGANTPPPPAATATDETDTPPRPTEPFSGQAQAPVTEPVAGPSPAATTQIPTVESTVRVDVELLASMLDLVGELVLARNELRSI